MIKPVTIHSFPYSPKSSRIGSGKTPVEVQALKKKVSRVTCDPAARAILGSLLLYVTDREDGPHGPPPAGRAEGGVSRAGRAPEPQDAQRRPTRFQLLQAKFMGTGREPRLKRTREVGRLIFKDRQGPGRSQVTATIHKLLEKAGEGAGRPAQGREPLGREKPRGLPAGRSSVKSILKVFLAAEEKEAQEKTPTGPSKAARGPLPKVGGRRSAALAKLRETFEQSGGLCAEAGLLPLRLDQRRKKQLPRGPLHRPELRVLRVATLASTCVRAPPARFLAGAAEPPLPLRVATVVCGPRSWRAPGARVSRAHQGRAPRGEPGPRAHTGETPSGGKAPAWARPSAPGTAAPRDGPETLLPGVGSKRVPRAAPSPASPGGDAFPGREPGTSPLEPPSPGGTGAASGDGKGAAQGARGASLVPWPGLAGGGAGAAPEVTLTVCRSEDEAERTVADSEPEPLFAVQEDVPGEKASGHIPPRAAPTAQAARRTQPAMEPPQVTVRLPVVHMMPQPPATPRRASRPGGQSWHLLGGESVIGNSGAPPPTLAEVGSRGARATGPSLAGLTPAGLTQAGLTQAGQTPAGLIPAGLTQAGQTPAGLIQEGLTQAGQTPAGLIPAGLTQAGQTPAGLIQEGLTQAGLSPPAWPQQGPGAEPTRVPSRSAAQCGADDVQGIVPEAVPMTKPQKRSPGGKETRLGPGASHRPPQPKDVRGEDASQLPPETPRLPEPKERPASSRNRWRGPSSWAPGGQQTLAPKAPRGRKELSVPTRPSALAEDERRPERVASADEGPPREQEGHGGPPSPPASARPLRMAEGHASHDLGENRATAFNEPTRPGVKAPGRVTAAAFSRSPPAPAPGDTLVPGSWAAGEQEGGGAGRPPGPGLGGRGCRVCGASGSPPAPPREAPSAQTLPVEPCGAAPGEPAAGKTQAAVAAGGRITGAARQRPRGESPKPPTPAPDLPAVPRGSHVAGTQSHALGAQPRAEDGTCLSSGAQLPLGAGPPCPPLPESTAAGRPRADGASRAHPNLQAPGDVVGGVRAGLGGGESRRGQEEGLPGAVSLDGPGRERGGLRGAKAGLHGDEEAARRPQDQVGGDTAAPGGAPSLHAGKGPEHPQAPRARCAEGPPQGRGAQAAESRAPSPSGGPEHPAQGQARRTAAPDVARPTSGSAEAAPTAGKNKASRRPARRGGQGGPGAPHGEGGSRKAPSLRAARGSAAPSAEPEGCRTPRAPTQEGPPDTPGEGGSTQGRGRGGRRAHLAKYRAQSFGDQRSFELCFRPAVLRASDTLTLPK